MGSKVLNPENINENVKKCVYAVRGELYLRASELQKQGKKIVFTNVGNPHALGQKPLTFPRQVMALCQAPFLMDDPNVGLLFPADAIAKAKHYLSLTSGGLGAYSDSKGIPGIRQEVAEFIERRDGHPRYTNIFAMPMCNCLYHLGMKDLISIGMQLLTKGQEKTWFCTSIASYNQNITEFHISFFT
ncbi:hypothetical protein O6H91_05G036100 [Diphasiastrum complanatum]|uniref:Uncharacterized protein n=1 Tax=Diphasiastrum complanatum TaxID=34168 RepID=A0ACC2DMD7_DIPCM|nr:hypothetical protein O6H91_05G036100 [Diphasiastrum complanatum]